MTKYLSILLSFIIMTITIIINWQNMACSLSLTGGGLKGDPEHQISIPDPPPRPCIIRASAR